MTEAYENVIPEIAGKMQRLTEQFSIQVFSHISTGGDSKGAKG
jgi:hypothetical protein